MALMNNHDCFHGNRNRVVYSGLCLFVIGCKIWTCSGCSKMDMIVISTWHWRTLWSPRKFYWTCYSTVEEGCAILGRMTEDQWQNLHGWIQTTYWKSVLPYPRTPVGFLQHLLALLTMMTHFLSVLKGEWMHWWWLDWIISPFLWWCCHHGATLFRTYFIVILLNSGLGIGPIFSFVSCDIAW
jgi:hypothetical protein